MCILFSHSNLEMVSSVRLSWVRFLSKNNLMNSCNSPKLKFTFFSFKNSEIYRRGNSLEIERLWTQPVEHSMSLRDFQSQMKMLIWFWVVQCWQLLNLRYYKGMNILKRLHNLDDSSYESVECSRHNSMHYRRASRMRRSEIIIFPSHTSEVINSKGASLE